MWQDIQETIERITAQVLGRKPPRNPKPPPPDGPKLELLVRPEAEAQKNLHRSKPRPHKS